MKQQLTLEIQLNDEATFANFNWHNNELLQQQLMALLNGSSERILYLWGLKGSGKTHILQACCQAVHLTRSSIYLPLTLLREYGPQALEGLEDQALVCIDDIDFIAKNPDWEEAVFHLYNRIKDSDRNILILSGCYPPAQAPLQLPDLRSRLSGGLVMHINELNDEEKIVTLKMQALKRGLNISTKVSQFLLNRCSRNMHDLQMALDHLDNASLVAQRKITIPFVKEILRI